MLKTKLSLLIVFFCLFNLNAQTESNIDLKIETGFLWDWVEGRMYFSGPFLNLEPKLKTSKNTFIGLRFGAAINTQRILTADHLQFYINNEFYNGGNGNNAIISLIPTFDYYFKENNARPYLGLGLGYYSLSSSKQGFVIGNDNEPFELSVENQIGFLIRGGINLQNVVVGRFDLSRITIGVEYNYIPTADVSISNGQKIGTILNSNIALSFGYLIGASKKLK